MSDPSDKDLPDEQQLAGYLKGGSSVSQQYGQLRSAEVPAELDRLVLRQAHDAVKSTRPAKPRTWLRWTAPLAVAASAVLVVSIVIESGVRDEVTLSAPAPASAPMEAKRESETADRDTSGNIADEAPTAAPMEPSRPFVLPREVAEPDTAASSAYVAPAHSKAAAPPPKADTSSQDQTRRERRTAPARQPVANSSPSPSSGQVVVNAAFLKEAERALAQDGMTSPAIQHSAGMAASGGAPAPEFAADAGAEEQKSQALRQYSDPELWLRDIRQLRRENQKDLADKEWRRFRAAFPNYVVDERDTAREVGR